MKFPAMDRNRSYSVRVPQLSGGVNYEDALSMVEDNQLTDVRNMWWKNGALRTRVGIENKDEYTDSVHDHSAIAGRLYTSELDFNNFTKSLGKFFVDYINYDSDSYKTRVGFTKIDGSFIMYGSGSYGESIEYSDKRYIDGRESVIIAEDKTGINYGTLYYFDGVRKIYEISMNAPHLYPVEITNPYKPLVCVNIAPLPIDSTSEPKGTFFEGYNMITPAYRMMYTPDGVGKAYRIMSRNVALKRLKVSVTGSNGNVTVHTLSTSDPDGFTSMSEDSIQDDGYKMSYDSTKGFIFYNSSGSDVALPNIGVSSSIVAEITPVSTEQDTENYKKIARMRFSTWFGGDRSGSVGGTRLFVSGNPDCKNVVYWSDINNPLYFPENNYAYIGDASQKVTAFAKQSDMLVIFKEREIYQAKYVAGSPYTAEDVINGKITDVTSVSASFPVTPISPYIGCDLMNTVQLCNNRLIWATKSGDIYTLTSANQYSERNVRKLSLNIDRVLKECNLENAVAADFGGYYIIFAGNNAFALDYNSTAFTSYSSYSNDERAQSKLQWYCWDFEFDGEKPNYILCYGDSAVINTEKTFSDETYYTYIEKTYSLSGSSDIMTAGSQGNVIRCMLQTKLFDFNYSERLKNIHSVYVGIANIEGCTINLTYITERGDSKDQYIVTKESASEYSPNYISEKRFMPNWGRIQRFGIRLESVGTMAVDGISLKYSMYGGVR